MNKNVLVVGTGDTKSRELRYVKDVIEAAGVPARFVDVGTTGHESDADVTPAEVAAHHPDGADAVRSDDRGAAVAAMAVALEHYVVANQDEIAGIIGAGGSGGTALVTPAMRALPIGVPKLMVSTVASSNVAPYVGPSDIAMMYSVTDVAGLNRISRQVLGNAANAMAGMAGHEIAAGTADLPPIGLTHVRRHDATGHPLGRGARRSLRSARLPCHRHRRPVDGEAGRLRDGRRRSRHDHHRGRRPPRGWRVLGRPRPDGCDRPHERSLCRVGRRARHGELRSARDGARASSPTAICTSTIRRSR